MLFNAKNITGGFEMENKIFISWSGEKSKQIASTFYDWFYNTFKIEAWFSSKNIKIGELWEPKIQEALQQSTKGIFFITKENVFAPWINFEAGAISKGNPENFVCIIRVDSNEIPKESPLFHYQNTAFNKEGICELLNNILIDSPDYNEENFKKLFDTNWKEFYKKYLKIIYSDNPLLDEKYAPGFISIIPENNKKELKKADKRSINNFFKQEYEKIDPNSIGKRLQFIIDRTVIFVYLDNNECWGKYVSELERINSEQNSRKDFKSYQIAILILKEVFSYHKMMSGTEYEYSINSEPEDINDELYELSKIIESEPNLIKNKMLLCLLYDYLGLSSLKTACKQIAKSLNKDYFNILSKNDREEFKILKIEDSNEIVKNIKHAIEWFDKVLKLTEYKNKLNFKLMRDYIWDDYALYNKARNQYLLNCLGLEDDSWKTTMKQAVKERKRSVDKYQDMPFAILSNLYAEYLYARLEQFSYLNEKPDNNFDKEYNKWIELCYEDILNVQNKYEKVKLN